MPPRGETTRRPCNPRPTADTSLGRPDAEPSRPNQDAGHFLMTSRLTRRRFLLAAAAVGVGAARAADRRPTILLRSGWQTVNIGDIAHTPGLLALLERHLPAADVVLWPNK